MVPEGRGIMARMKFSALGTVLASCILAAGGLPVAAGTALTSTTVGGDNPRVYYQGDDRRIHELAWWGDHWNHAVVGLDVPPAVAGTALTSTIVEGDNPRVYYQGDDRHIHELAWWGDHWNHAVVGPPAVAGTALTSTTVGGRRAQREGFFGIGVGGCPADGLISAWISNHGSGFH
jgi:hypothetical protein